MGVYVVFTSGSFSFRRAMAQRLRLLFCSLPFLAGAIFTTPLVPVRRCYIRPPEANSGCVLLQNLTDAKTFGLNKFGQDTTGQRQCLEALRKAGC